MTNIKHVTLAGAWAALSGCILLSQKPTVVEMRLGETVLELRDRVRELPPESEVCRRLPNFKPIPFGKQASLTGDDDED